MRDTQQRVAQPSPYRPEREVAEEIHVAIAAKAFDAGVEVKAFPNGSGP
jgi:hypothetical protein